MTQTVFKACIWLLVFALFGAACSSSAVKPARVTVTPKPTIALQPCHLGVNAALCGTLKVYENRAAHTGRMIDLNVAVIKALDEHPAPDPIFFLSGGPGGAATEDIAKGQQFPVELTRNHDLVLVDQRGTGGSHRVVIPNDQPDLSGLSLEEADPRFKIWVDKTLAEIEKDTDPRFYTTAIAMDDLDEVRQALGYDKINLFGHSYGATAAQYYLRQHEDHVRTVVLSGGSLLDVPIFERWAKNGQRALDMVFDWCQADAACQKAYPNLRAEFADLLARADRQPVKVTYGANHVTFTKDYLAEIIRMMTLDIKFTRRLPMLIHRAYAENDWQGIAEMAVNYGAGDWGPQLMEHVIRCSEKWAAFDPAEVARLGEGTYLKGWYVSLAQNHAIACKYTPRGGTPRDGVPPEGADPQPGSSVPVLIFNGEADPQNPPENMAGAKALWPNSLSIVEPYQGHWLSDMDEIFCRWDITNQFVQSGSVVGLKTGCLEEIPPPAFVVE